MKQLSPAAQIVLEFAGLEARALEHKELDVEHAFLGLCKLDEVAHFFQERDLPAVSLEEVGRALQEIQEFIDLLEQREFPVKKARRSLRKLLLESVAEHEKFSGLQSSRCRKALALADRLSLDSGDREIGLKHLLLAVLSQESPALDFLFTDLGMERKHLVQGIVSSPAFREEILRMLPAKIEGSEPPRRQKTVERAPTPILDKFGRDLTQLAREGKLVAPIGRKDELRRIGQTLVRIKKNNLILLGDAGVGKTSIVEGFAIRAVDPQAPQQIRNLRIVELTLGSLVAGTRYRGDFEERLEQIIKEASSDSNIVLFIDEIHLLVGAGSSGGQTMDAASILKPVLARGTIRVIGATTPSEYRTHIESDSALQRRFHVFWVNEPTREEAIEILQGTRLEFEKYYCVQIPDPVVERCVDLSIRYLPDFRLPDKAVDLLDQACARLSLKTISPMRLDEESSPKQITIEDVEKVVAERCRIPMENLTRDEADRLLEMEKHLTKRVIGQDHAIREVAETIRSARAGLRDPRKPAGIFLFLGSTGTGKTELAKAMAEFLFGDENHLIVFDMSEYQEKGSTSKLLGAPPGYIGYENEGLLTARVRNRPYSVILFDEIEKAHSDIFYVLLQVFDEGRLTDSHGRRIDFRETVIVLTSNIGSKVASVRKPIGFDPARREESTISALEANQEKWAAYEAQIFATMAEAFAPEFINRIQKKILFYPLERRTVEQIVMKMLGELNDRLADRQIQVSFASAAVDLLLENGFSEEYGAREMKRAFEQYVAEPVGKMILSGKLTSRQSVSVTESDNEMQFHIAPA